MDGLFIILLTRMMELDWGIYNLSQNVQTFQVSELYYVNLSA